MASAVVVDANWMAKEGMPRIWGVGNLLEIIFERANWALRQGVSVKDMPAAVALTVFEGMDKEVFEMAYFKEFDLKLFEVRKKWRGDDNVSPQLVKEALMRCKTFLPIDGCHIVTQLYTNQCFSESVLGITNTGNAGVIAVLDCKARMEIRQGKILSDESRLDTWIAYAISTDQHAACKSIFQKREHRLEFNVRQFWTEQGMDGMQEYIWATDESLDIIRYSEGPPGMGLGEDEEWDADDNDLAYSVEELVLLRELTCGEGVQLV